MNIIQRVFPSVPISHISSKNRWVPDRDPRFHIGIVRRTLCPNEGMGWLPINVVKDFSEQAMFYRILQMVDNKKENPAVQMINKIMK